MREIRAAISEECANAVVMAVRDAARCVQSRGVGGGRLDPFDELSLLDYSWIEGGVLSAPPPNVSPRNRIHK